MIFFGFEQKIVLPARILNVCSLNTINSLVYL